MLRSLTRFMRWGPAPTESDDVTFSAPVDTLSQRDLYELPQRLRDIQRCSALPAKTKETARVREAALNAECAAREQQLLSMLPTLAPYRTASRAAGGRYVSTDSRLNVAADIKRLMWLHPSIDDCTREQLVKLQRRFEEPDYALVFGETKAGKTTTLRGITGLGEALYVNVQAATTVPVAVRKDPSNKPGVALRLPKELLSVLEAYRACWAESEALVAATPDGFTAWCALPEDERPDAIEVAPTATVVGAASKWMHGAMRCVLRAGHVDAYSPNGLDEIPTITSRWVLGGVAPMPVLVDMPGASELMDNGGRIMQRLAAGLVAGCGAVLYMRQAGASELSPNDLVVAKDIAAAVADSKPVVLIATKRDVCDAPREDIMAALQQFGARIGVSSEYACCVSGKLASAYWDTARVDRDRVLPEQALARAQRMHDLIAASGVVDLCDTLTHLDRVVCAGRIRQHLARFIATLEKMCVDCGTGALRSVKASEETLARCQRAAARLRDGCRDLEWPPAAREATKQRMRHAADVYVEARRPLVRRSVLQRLGGLQNATDDVAMQVLQDIVRPHVAEWPAALRAEQRDVAAELTQPFSDLVASTRTDIASLDELMLPHARIDAARDAVAAGVAALDHHVDLAGRQLTRQRVHQEPYEATEWRWFLVVPYRASVIQLRDVHVAEIDTDRCEAAVLQALRERCWAYADNLAARLAAIFDEQAETLMCDVHRSCIVLESEVRRRKDSTDELQLLQPALALVRECVAAAQSAAAVAAEAEQVLDLASGDEDRDTAIANSAVVLCDLDAAVGAYGGTNSPQPSSPAESDADEGESEIDADEIVVDSDDSCDDEAADSDDAECADDAASENDTEESNDGGESDSADSACIATVAASRTPQAQPRRSVGRKHGRADSEDTTAGDHERPAQPAR